MALRLIEVFLPADQDSETVLNLLQEQPAHGIWHYPVAKGEHLLRILIDTKDSESVLDLLEKQFAAMDGFRVVLLPVEAVLPRIEEPEEQPDKTEPGEEKPASNRQRISREELYQDIKETCVLSPMFVGMVVLSSIVAALGLCTDNLAVLIGAMVIAPLLGPNVALSFATTLGDVDLGWLALKTNAVGVAIAFTVACAIGLIVPFDPENLQIASRTYVGLEDLALALAAGSAGALAYTTGVSGALIGVMVAVALVPPLINVGLLLVAREFSMAGGALLLVTANVICVNLSGVVAFLAQGLRPLSWWEAKRARRLTTYALLVWLALFAVLTVVIVVSRA